MFEDLVDSLKSIAARCSVARDASDSSAVPKDAHWVTTEKGHHVLIRNKDGKPVAGNGHVLAAMTGKGDVRYSIPHIFTGSSSNYEKPSLVHVGEGEGNQVYGWGLYGSDQRGVAEEYARIATTGTGNPESAAQAAYEASGKDADAAARILDIWKGSAPDETRRKIFEDAVALLKKGSFKPSQYVYEQTFFTNRAPGDESHLISWYDYISDENLERILSRLKEEGVADQFKDMYWLRYKGMSSYLENGDIEGAILDNGSSGDAVYNQLVSILGSPKEVSEFLARADIDGIKYPVDSYGSKTIKNGDEAGWNYVTFRDDNIRVDRKWIDGKEVATVGSMVKALKDWVPGMEVEEVDGLNVSPDSKRRYQAAAMARTGRLSVNGEEGVEGLRQRMLSTPEAKIVKEDEIPAGVISAYEDWKRTGKVSQKKALARAILDTMPKANRTVSVPGVGSVQITVNGIAEVLSHVNPNTPVALRAIRQCLSAENILAGSVSFYSERKGRFEYQNVACRSDDGKLEIYTVKESWPGEFVLHSANSSNINENTSRTNVVTPSGERLAYTTGAPNTGRTNVGSQSSESLIYTAGVPNARIIAQGLIDRQWGDEGKFHEYLDSADSVADSSNPNIVNMVTKNGSVAGCYNRKTGRVSLVKGVATPATVAHEISWHATFHWAEKNHPELHKTLMRYAKEAPSGIEQSVRERYDGMNLSPEALLDEIGAERFTREDLSPLLDGIAKKQAEGWFDKVEDAQDEARGAFVTAHAKGGNATRSLPKEEIDRIAALPPKEAVAALVQAMLEGRSLPAKDSATDAAIVPCGALVDALRRIADAASA